MLIRDRGFYEGIDGLKTFDESRVENEALRVTNQQRFQKL